MANECKIDQFNANLKLMSAVLIHTCLTREELIQAYMSRERYVCVMRDKTISIDD